MVDEAEPEGSPEARRHVPESFTRPSATLFVIVGIMMVVGGGAGTVASLSIASQGLVAYVLAGVASIFTGAGGVVISWVGASLHERKNATQALEAHMDSVSQNLTLAVSQVDNVIRQVQNEEASPEVALALVDQSMLTISGQIRQLQILLGKPLDTQEQIDTRRKVRSLAAEIADSAKSGAIVPEEKVAQLLTLTEKLSAQAPRPRVTPTTPSSSFGNVECPHCGLLNEVRVGDRKGDTKKALCRQCGEIFNVHRAEAGRLISRPAVGSTGVVGQGGPIRVRDEACECSARLVVHYTQGAASKEFFCGSCGRRYELNQTNGEARFIETWPLVPSTITGVRKSRPVAMCPTCRREFSLIVPSVDGFASACNEDRVILTTTTAEFEDFKTRAA